ncbi:MAG: HEAT repeat domain-containing protein [Alicyclobacillus sp.]|nr:HEAT repeat domain-containing protein [Alicyclobacillus sp.]
MPRLSLKVDSSFFQKISLGAIGVRSVREDMDRLGHRMVELERGSSDTKLWKEVKRKRVRIPDLICLDCGLRIESRAKSNYEISMSHSYADQERAWDFGMVDSDIVAFPVCKMKSESNWSVGRLRDDISYWHERTWTSWARPTYINYFRVSDFRRVNPASSSTKGVTEGSETSIQWRAIFSTMTGVVESVENGKIRIRSFSGRRYTWQNKRSIPVTVEEGQEVTEGQVIACEVPIIPKEELICPRTIDSNSISKLLRSRERTQRFAGVKLARLRKDHIHRDFINEIVNDTEEDIYVRLEGIAYLVSVCGEPADIFRAYLTDKIDDQVRLETVITLSEVGTENVVHLLSEILDDPASPSYLRSASAWALSRIGTDSALKKLVKAFADISEDIKQEALGGIVSIGDRALALLTNTIVDSNNDIAAGSAEALRQLAQLAPLPESTIKDLSRFLRMERVPNWVVWLLGHLPRDHTAGAIAEIQDLNPEVHYALSILWCFTDSWISRYWDRNPYPEPIN